MKTNERIGKLNTALANADARKALDLVIKEFGDKIVFASSLGAEDQVITEMIAGIDKRVKIFTLDTGRLFPETYETLERTTNRYGMPIEVFFPNAEHVEAMVRSRGINLFYETVENRKLCCHIRKIEPLTRAFTGMEAWICGLRREQSVTRQDMKMVEWDDQNKLIKINPLIDWTETQVWHYIKEKNIPYNKLHDQGFPSIGCQPCTRAIQPGEDIRAGRWWWESPQNKECGLHKK
jgi:phosophoadenylyl-sulfate reductase (thioredoxin)/thioredoxin-dependent adenylylsulfate APS reductase